MHNTNKVILIISSVLGITYFSLISLASNGYGYMGYYGYHRGPSLWYFGGTSIYHDRNIRNGSVSGARVRGRGPSSGK